MRPAGAQIGLTARARLVPFPSHPLLMPERRHRVVPITLRGEHAAEVIPLLVDEATWILVRLGTRWIVRDRRWLCMPSTLADTLRSLRLAHEWA